jgi:hypothetical protein
LIAVPAAFAVLGFAAALIVRRRLGLLALGGILLGVLLWIVYWAAGAFEDDAEGTAGILTFVYGVPAVALAWALGVGVAALAGTRR